MLLTDQDMSTVKPSDATNGALILADGDINITETRVITYFDEDLQGLQLFGEHYDYLEKTSEAPVPSGEAAVYELTSTDITDYEAKFTLNPASPTNEGKEIKPEVVIDELKEGVHYTYEYVGAFINDGTAKTPLVTVAGLTQNLDYEVRYENNINAGNDACVILTGKGNYTGTVRKNFKIVEPAGATQKNDSGNTDSASTGENVSSSTMAQDSTRGSDMNPGGGITADGIPYGPAKGKTIKNKTYKFKITKRAKGKAPGTVSLCGLAKKSRKKTVKKVNNPASVTIGGFKYKVTRIGKKAFSGCKKLKMITIRAKKLKAVGKNAIKGISKKATIRVPKKRQAYYKKLFKARTGFKKTMKIRK